MKIMTFKFGFFGVIFTGVSFLVNIFNLLPLQKDSPIGVSLVLQFIGFIAFVVVLVSCVPNNGIED